jgi:hypothetical protein
MAEARTGIPSREDTGVSTARVVIVAAGSLIFVALCLVGLRAYYMWAAPTAVAPQPRTFAAPQLETDPSADLKRLQSEQRRRLSEYAWEDKMAGIARIPITQAMELLVARGRQAYAPLEPEQKGPNAATGSERTP